MDHASFRVFYEKTVPALRAYAIRSSGEVDLADDIVQEAFLRFLRSAPATLSEPQMRSYLYRTVETLILNRWRRSQREKARAEETRNELSTTNTPDTANDMTRAFARLDPKQRSLLWLAYVEGFDHKEIAATVNIQEKSVRVLLYRARQTLLGILKSAGIGPEVL
jgi:RNA polymerase sigma-70 factor, ECF subfamily